MDTDSAHLPEWVGEVQDTLQDLEELSEIVPYVRHFASAWQWGRRRRVRRFLRALDSAVGEMSGEQRERFEKILASNEGRELLADFSDSVYRTASPTANAALGLLYADADESRYSLTFKRAAVRALDGITEDLVEVFLGLAKLESSEVFKDWSFPVYQWEHPTPEDIPELDELAPELADKVAFYSELRNRGMVIPFEVSTYGGGGNIKFGWPDRSTRFADLLLRAREMLPDEESP